MVCSIQLHAVSDRTRPGSEPSSLRYASTASIFSSMLPYTFPSTHRRTSLEHPLDRVQLRTVSRLYDRRQPHVPHRLSTVTTRPVPYQRLDVPYDASGHRAPPLCPQTSSSRSTSTPASPSERLGPRTGTSICTPTAPAAPPSLHDDPRLCAPSPAAPRASRRQSQTPYPNSPQHRRVRDRAPLFPGPLSRCVRLLMSTTRHLRTASQPRQQRVHAARRVADCVLGLYPVPDLSRCTESSRGHLLGQLPLLLNTQIARLTSASHLVSEHLLHTSLSVPAHHV